MSEREGEQRTHRGMDAEELRQHGEVEDQHLRVGDVGQEALSPAGPCGGPARLATRVGLEDTLTLPDGSAAGGNAALVEAAYGLDTL